MTMPRPLFSSRLFSNRLLATALLVALAACAPADARRPALAHVSAYHPISGLRVIGLTITH
ncbi:MAG: hypothetical protein ABIW31_01325, partial [Novosphingobium sp.]